MKRGRSLEWLVVVLVVLWTNVAYGTPVEIVGDLEVKDVPGSGVPSGIRFGDGTKLTTASLPSCPVGQVLVSTGAGWQCGLISPFTGGIGMCVGGSCTIISCNPDSADCDKIASNGCEVYLKTDANNCGSCGTACGSGESCGNGVCVCQPGYVRCSGSCVNLANDASNCGSCGNHCLASQVCTAGACICQPGYVVCSGSCVNLTNDNNHCGSCTISCASRLTCVSGQCM